MRGKENGQLIVGEYDAGHTTVRLFNMSVYLSLNVRKCKARFVITQWKGVEDLSVSLIGGVSLVVCLLSWLGRRMYQPCTSMGQVYQGALQCQSVASLVLRHVVVYVFWVAGWGPAFHFGGSCSVCLLTKEGLGQHKRVVLSPAMDPHRRWWPAEEVCGECIGKGLLPLLAAAGV